MIKALIIDDEVMSINSLTHIVESNNMSVDIVGTAQNVKSGVELIKSTKIDLLFLDIEMPDGTGFDLLDQLEKIDFHIIFITAFNQYAIKAFRYAALDYLMKPLNIQELNEALDKVKQYNYSDGNKRVSLLLDNHKSENKFEKLAVATTEGVFYYDVDKLVRCEADGSYTKLIAEEQNPIIASKSIKEYEAILPDNFFRVHKSHLVNFHYIKKYQSGDRPFILLKDDTEVAVSRRRKMLVSEKLSDLRS